MKHVRLSSLALALSGLTILFWLSTTPMTGHTHPRIAAPPAQQHVRATASAPGSTPHLLQEALERGEIDQDTYYLYLAYALSGDERLPAHYHSSVPWSGTGPLRELRQAMPHMPENGTTRREVERISQGGGCDMSTDTLSNTVTTEHFFIEYNSPGGGLDIDTYSTTLETVWTTEVDTFGWAAPPVLGSNPPPGNRYHVRIDDLGSGLYGYVASAGVHAGLVGDNPNTAWTEDDAYATCMVLNSDYSDFASPPLESLQATAAHEFNHSLQAGYGEWSGNTADLSMFEASATWMEDEVFDDANDNYFYLWPDFATCMGEYTRWPYPYWITLRGMTEPYGAGTAGGSEQIVQDFWEEMSKNTSGSSNMFSALNTSLVNQGTTLADAYHNYAIAVRFNRACEGDYAYPYCLEEGPSYVAQAGAPQTHGSIDAVGESHQGTVQNNYALNWVELPTGISETFTISLTNTAGGGELRASLACDTGTAMDVTPWPAVVGAGETGTLEVAGTQGCASLVAVITNQEQTSDNPTFCTAHGYTLETAAEVTNKEPETRETFVPVIRNGGNAP